MARMHGGAIALDGSWHWDRMEKYCIEEGGVLNKWHHGFLSYNNSTGEGIEPIRSAFLADWAQTIQAVNAFGLANKPFNKS